MIEQRSKHCTYCIFSFSFFFSSHSLGRKWRYMETDTLSGKPVRTLKWKTFQKYHDITTNYNYFYRISGAARFDRQDVCCDLT